MTPKKTYSFLSLFFNRTLTNNQLRESPPMTEKSPGKPPGERPGHTILFKINKNYPSATKTNQPSHTAHAGSATRPPCRGKLSYTNQ